MKVAMSDKELEMEALCIATMQPAMQPAIGWKIQEAVN